MRIHVLKPPPPLNPRSKLVASALDHVNSSPETLPVLVPATGMVARISLPPSQHLDPQLHVEINISANHAEVNATTDIKAQPEGGAK